MKQRKIAYFCGMISRARFSNRAVDGKRFKSPVQTTLYIRQVTHRNRKKLQTRDMVTLGFTYTFALDSHCPLLDFFLNDILLG